MIFGIGDHLLQAKHLVITREKKRLGIDGPFLSFAIICKYRATNDLNVEAIFFSIERGWCSQLI